jgi:hypothetical protein
MVCAKHLIGSNFVFAHPMVLLVDEDQVEAQLSSFGDSSNLEEK